MIKNIFFLSLLTYLTLPRGAQAALYIQCYSDDNSIKLQARLADEKLEPMGAWADIEVEKKGHSVSIPTDALSINKRFPDDFKTFKRKESKGIVVFQTKSTAKDISMTFKINEIWDVETCEKNHETIGIGGTNCPLYLGTLSFSSKEFEIKKIQISCPNPG